MQTPHRDKAASRGTMGHHRASDLQSTPSPPFHTRVRAWGDPGEDLISPPRGSELGEADVGMMMNGLSVSGAAAAGAEAGRTAAAAGMGLEATSPSHHTQVKKSPPKSAATRRQQHSNTSRPTFLSARNAERPTTHTSHTTSPSQTDNITGAWCICMSERVESAARSAARAVASLKKETLRVRHVGWRVVRAGHTSSLSRSPQGHAHESTSSLGTATSADNGGASLASAGSSRAGAQLSGHLLNNSTHLTRSPSPVKHRQSVSSAAATRRSPSSSRSSAAAAAAAAKEREKKDRLPSLSVSCTYPSRDERHHKGDPTVSVGSPRLARLSQPHPSPLPISSTYAKQIRALWRRCRRPRS